MSQKNLRILWLYPNQHMRVTPPGGVAIISACLKRAGYHNIELFDATWYPVDKEVFAQPDRDKERIKRQMFPDYEWKRDDVPKDFFVLEDVDMYTAFRKKVIDFKPDVIISSIVEDTYYLWNKFMDQVSDRKFINVVGGVFVTYYPKAFEGKCDYICRGEGDEVIPELMDHISENKTGHHLLNVHPNPMRPAMNVNTLPPTDHLIFDKRSLYRPFQGEIIKVATVETQRGCPFKCKFCNSPSNAGLYKEETDSLFFRKRTVKHQEEEINHLIDTVQVEFLWIVTDTFLTMSKKGFDEWAEMYSKYKIPFFTQTRPELLTPYQARTLKELGCVKMNMGVEHGDPQFRKDVVGRIYDNQKAIDAFAIAREAGLSTTCNFIIGYPYETMENCMKSVELAAQLHCNDTNAFIYTPYHGTPMRDMCVDAGFVDKDLIVEMKSDDQLSYLDMPSPYMSKKDIQYMFNNFVRLFREREHAIMSA
tara:strand:- start:530 stop:1960 length:1431 start_codon:yes stop_codon:yes gene_type:complete